MGLALLFIFFAGLAVGLIGSSLLGSLAVLLLQRDERRRLHGWWVFGAAMIVLTLVTLRFAQMLPTGVNIPNSMDAGVYFRYSIGRGLSVGVGAALAALVTILIPRPRRVAGPPPGAMPPPLPPGASAQG